MLHSRGVSFVDSLAPLATLLPLVWVLAWGSLWLSVSGPLFLRRPRACFALYFALFVEAVVTLIFNHLTHSIFSAWRTLSLPLPVCWAVVAVFGLSESIQVKVSPSLYSSSLSSTLFSRSSNFLFLLEALSFVLSTESTHDTTCILCHFLLNLF